MKSKDNPLVPKSVIIRWLQESSDTDDFRRRLDNYVMKHPTNWSLED